MTQREAMKRCDQLRQNAARTGLTYEVEKLVKSSTCRKWVVRSYRDGVSTGSTYHR